MALQGLRAFPTLLRIGLAEAVAYRAELVVWMLTTTMPLVNMALWSTVARDQRIGPERFGSADFMAYFLLVLVVRLLTGSWVLWLMNTEIRSGALSQRLLRPVHPLLCYTAENLSALPLRGALVLPLCLLILFLYQGSRLTHDPFLVGAFFLALPGAWLITFLSMVVFGALAFYIESTLALFQLWMGSYTIFSGYLVPLSLLPRPVRALADVLPFRYVLDFPVKLLLGMPGRAPGHLLVLKHLGIEYAHVLGLLLLSMALWRAGLRRYEAYGA